MISNHCGLLCGFAKRNYEPLYVLSAFMNIALQICNSLCIAAFSRFRERISCWLWSNSNFIYRVLLLCCYYIFYVTAKMNAHVNTKYVDVVFSIISCRVVHLEKQIYRKIKTQLVCIFFCRYSKTRHGKLKLGKLI